MKSLVLVYFVLIIQILSATIINIPADYSTIQTGINASNDADTVLVQPGTYYENINFNGKNITVASLFLISQDTTYISQTIIDGSQMNYSVVKFINGEDASALIRGFSLVNGSTSSDGGGICCENSSPTICNLIIENNDADYGGDYISLILIQ
jgi:hypothetical protein